jgi:FtsX-like permease family
VVISGALALFALRDRMRHPAESVLLLLALSAATALLATPLLLLRAVEGSARRALDAGPALVVRRLDAGGFAPMPATSLAAAARIRGVTSARARVWGIATGPRGPVTVVGVDESLASVLHARALPVPTSGTALAGSATDLSLGQPGILRGAVAMPITLAAILPSYTAIAGADAVLLSLDDARQVLGLAPDQISDLALDVFHESEAEALLPELARAFPWPVHLVTRREMKGIHATSLLRRGGLATFMAVPSVLALALLVLTTLRDGFARRREMGLHKALGWTTPDIVRLQLWRSLAVAIPAVTLGLVLSLGLSVGPGTSFTASLLLGGQATTGLLSIETGAALAVMLEIGALILVPFLAAALWPAARAASADPSDLLLEEP